MYTFFIKSREYKFYIDFYVIYNKRMIDHSIYVPNKYADSEGHVDISDAKLGKLMADRTRVSITLVQYPEYKERGDAIIANIDEHMKWIMDLRSLIYSQIPPTVN